MLYDNNVESQIPLGVRQNRLEKFQKVRFWWADKELNLGLSTYQIDVLPLNYPPIKSLSEVWAGFAPADNGFADRRVGLLHHQTCKTIISFNF